MEKKRLTRRSPAARLARRAPTPPRFTRLEGNLTLEAPDGYLASAIFKLIGHDGVRRIYALWLLVGRSEHDRVAVPYKFTGEDTIRCDLPSGNLISITALEPHLRKFLETDGFLGGGPPAIANEGDPPVIKTTPP